MSFAAMSLVSADSAGLLAGHAIIHGPRRNPSDRVARWDGVILVIGDASIGKDCKDE